MATTFETSLHLKPHPTLPSTFTITHPPWTWPFSPVVPGGTLLSLAASAASRTVAPSSPLTNAQIHFLSGPTATQPITFTVSTLSTGRRFQTRYVHISQNTKPMCFVTLTFTAPGAWKGKSMKHTESRRTTLIVDEIKLDDLAAGRGAGKPGPFMSFERLPIVFPSGPSAPEAAIASVICKITPQITSPDPFTHVLGLLSLSDYHVLDFPPNAHSLPVGLAPIGAPIDQRTTSQFKLFTSLNHTIHIHQHEGFRADELTYVEVSSPWARDGRAVIHSKIFDKDGVLLASCVQEAYYVLRDDAKSGTGSKL